MRVLNDEWEVCRLRDALYFIIVILWYRGVSQTRATRCILITVEIGVKELGNFAVNLDSLRAFFSTAGRTTVHLAPAYAIAQPLQSVNALYVWRIPRRNSVSGKLLKVSRSLYKPRLKDEFIQSNSESNSCCGTTYSRITLKATINRLLCTDYTDHLLTIKSSSVSSISSGSLYNVVQVQLKVRPTPTLLTSMMTL